MKTKKINPIISIGIIPIEMLLGALIVKTPIIGKNETLSALIIFAISVIGFLLMIYLNKELLIDDWKKFNNQLGKKFLFGIIGVVMLHLILKLVRLPLGNLSANTEVDINKLPLYVSILVAIMPMFSPILEEVTFRHHLFYNFKNSTVRGLMFIVSSILFGLIHYSSFSSLIDLIPYMVMGAIFAAIYQITKNIWASITVHFLFNLIPTVLSIIALIVTKFVS